MTKCMISITKYAHTICKKIKTKSTNELNSRYVRKFEWKHFGHLIFCINNKSKEIQSRVNEAWKLFIFKEKPLTT